MSLCFSREQREFAGSVGQVLDDLYDEFTERDTLVTDDAWLAVAEQLSLCSIAAPEDRGGFGGTWQDVAAAMEQFGHRPVLGGLPVALAGVAALLAAPGGDDSDPLIGVLDQQQVIVPTWLFSDRRWSCSGDGMITPSDSIAQPRWFEDPADAEVLIAFPAAASIRLLAPVTTSAGLTEVWLSEPIDAGALLRDGTLSIDTSLRLGRVPDDAKIPAVSAMSAEIADAAIIRSRAVAHAMSAIEAVGSCDRLLERALEYLKVREQFGQTLASMQGLKFMAADLFREIEPLRSLAYAAVAALDGADLAEVEETATAAKIAADALHPKVALESMQLHGGIGFTWELGLHRHYKRAVANRVVGGDDQSRKTQLAARIRSGSTTLKSIHRDSDEAADGVRQEVRAWLADNAQHAPAAYAAHEPMTYEHSPEDVAWIDRVRGGGWLCLSWPKKYGGRELSPLECIAVNEEFAAAGVSRPVLGMGESLLAPAILSHGSEEQKERLLPRILSGEDVYCQGFSEPEHGSDLAKLETRGVIDGDAIVVNGTKVWQSGAHRANMIFLLCRTDPAASSHRGITYCIADMQDNGVDVQPIRMMPGDFGFNQVRFENTTVPLDNVIGTLHGGWHVAMTTLGAERAGEITSQYLGYLLEFDQLVAELGHRGRLDAAGDDLVSLWLEIAKMKYNGMRVVEQLRTGESADDLLSIDKLNWSEYHVRFGLEAARLLGTAGVVRPTGEGYQLTHLQRVMFESPGRRIARGTNQIQRRIIAERRLGMPK